MKITILGSGTSHGVPVAGCGCAVCRSPREENKRMRSSVYIRKGDTALLIDTAVEFRLQAIRADIRKVDGILLTHTHADHLHGLDDLRPFCDRAPIPLYLRPEACRELRERFPYIFCPPRQKGGGTPRIALQPLSGEPFRIGDLTVQPLPVFHGTLPILGFRLGPFAYITDCSAVPETTMPLLEGVEQLVIGALRHRPHPTHFSIGQALGLINKISPKRAYLTHICHEVEHFALKAELSGLGVEPAYDGQVIELTL